MSEHLADQILLPSSSLGQENIWPVAGKDLDGDGSDTSVGTVHRTRRRNPSLSSAGSYGSFGSGQLRVRNDYVRASQRTSASNFLFTDSPRGSLRQRPGSKQASHKSSWGTEIPVPPKPSDTSTFLLEAGPLEDVDLNAKGERAHRSGNTDAQTYTFTADPFMSFHVAQEMVARSIRNQENSRPSTHMTKTATPTNHPFRRWISTLRRKNSKHVGSLKIRRERWSLDDFDETLSATHPIPRRRTISSHRKTPSWSSSGLVEAVKSATSGLGSLNIAPPSQRKRKSVLRSSDGSSRVSYSGNRTSFESSHGSTHQLDEAALARAIQRRKTLEELIGSEESYISDLKVLVYFTLIESAPSVSLRTTSQVHRNVTEILHLHEEILSQIRVVMSDAEACSAHQGDRASRMPRYASRHYVPKGKAALSAGLAQVARRSLEDTWFGRSKGAPVVSDPREVANVAKVFDSLMSRFFIYEEYGAQYESMLRDMTSTSKTIPNWHVYERGIEALANSWATTNNSSTYTKKGLTFEDLLIKPIQRICKYPLLFADLYKNIPVVDGPESRVEVEKVLCRLQEAVKEINTATNDRETRARIQRSWHLQDLLVLPDPATTTLSLRLLGHASLCGVLFVAYQAYNSQNDLRGEYMLCVLFKSYFLLARPKMGSNKYDVVIIMSLRDLQLDRPNNGRGLQCHSAPYSWKLAFEVDQQLYELILCACSAREEEQWKSSLLKFSAQEVQMQTEDPATLPPLFSMIALDIRSLGYIFGLPGTLTRRLSIQRAATLDPKSNHSQVIIRNTHTLKDHCDSQISALDSISRSQSLLTTNRAVILAPKRVDRLRMEYGLADVWTKDLLPYPGMSTNRGEHLIRTSASSMMRKLSRASKTGSFKKRSASCASLADEKLASIPTDIDSVFEGEEADGQYNSHSYPSHITLPRREVSVLQPVNLPPRTSSANGMKPSYIAGRESCEHESESISKLTRSELVKLFSPQRRRSKWNRSKPLVKAFSAEGIRSWFT